MNINEFLSLINNPINDTGLNEYKKIEYKK